MMGSRSRIALLVVVVAATFVVAVTSEADTHDPWAGEPTLIGGTSRYAAGEWIYTDFVYDDYGADTTPGGQPNVVSLAPTSGDFRYPAGLGNAADVVEVRVRVAPNDSDLEVRVLLQTIFDAEDVALQVEANGEQAIVTSADATIDAGANTITFTLQGAADGDTVDLLVGAGLHDGEGGLRAGVTGSASMQPEEFTTGGPTDARLFDLAFNTHEIEGRGGAWNEDAQSDALQAGDLAPFTQEIDLEQLRDGDTTPVPQIDGYQVHLFESRQDLGEGMGASFPQYRGRWQPYAVWVPEGYHATQQPAPLFLSLHSLSVHHNQYRGGSSPSASYATYYEQFEAGIGAVVVTPLGRGPDGWYQDEGLVDTLEVWADAQARFSIDSDEVFVGGYSMGGYGTYRLATLMPDAFASAVSIVGPPADGIWAYPLPPSGGEDSPDNTRPQLENTRHVPIWITQGVADELVPVSGVIHQADRLDELGHEYRLAVHPAADHLSFVFQDDWSREVAWFAGHDERETDPAHVTFKVRPASWATDGDPVILGHVNALITEIGARLDGAYWVDDVTVAEGDDHTGQVDLTSRAVPSRQIGVDAVTTVGLDGPSPHTLTGQDQVFDTSPESDTLVGTLTDVTAVAIDLGRAGLSDDVVVDVDSNLEATITLLRDGGVIREVTIGAA